MSANNVIQLLGKAVLDQAFRARFLSDPEWALNQFSLTGSEQEALKAIKPDQLQALVDQFAKSGGGNVNQFLAKMIGDPGIMQGGVWDPGTLLGGPDTSPPNPDNPGGPQPHLEPEGPAPHLEQGGLGGPDTKPGGIGDPGIKPGGSWPASPEGDVSGDVNGDMPDGLGGPDTTPGGIGDPGIKQGGPTPHMQPGVPVDPCIVPGGEDAAPLDPCIVPGEIGDPGIRQGGPSPHMQERGIGDPGIKQGLPEPHMRPGVPLDPCVVPGEIGDPGIKPGGGAQEAGGGAWVPYLQRFLLPALLLLLLGGLLFGPPSFVGGMLSPLDAIGCTGVENVAQPQNFTPASGVTLISNPLQGITEEGPEEHRNQMAWLFNALNGLRGAIGQPPVPFSPECDENLSPFPPGIDLDSSCGDGVVDQGEQCDGSNLNQCLQGQNCHSCQCVWVVPAPTEDRTRVACTCEGVDLVCTDGTTQYNTSQCDGGNSCECRGTTFVCPDGTYAEFNPQCGVGGDQCANSSCGDGTCNAACGEDINTCAVDCHL